MSGQLFRAHAPDYWAANLPVIPLRHRSKAPAVKDWTAYGKSMPTPETREAWLRDHADGNLGLPLGPAAGVMVLDVDGAPLPDVMSFMHERGVAATWMRVGRKGAAFLFLYEGQVTQRFPLPTGEMGFELLSTGAQIVIPPSIHPDTGEAYTAEEGLIEAIHRAPSLPGGFLHQLALRVGASTSKRGGSALQSKATTGKIGVGGRDVAATQKAGALAKDVAQGRKTLDEAERELEDWFDEGIEQPKDDPIDFEKHRQQFVAFFLKDTIVRNKAGEPVLNFDGEPTRVAPLGWDDALTPGDLSRLDLLGVRIEDGGAVSAIARDFILVCDTKTFIHKATGEVLSSDHLTTRYGPYLEGRTGPEKLTSIISAREVERVDGAKLRPSACSPVFKEPPYKIYNLFRGFAATPARDVRDEDIAPFLELTALQVPNPIERNYLLDWEAYGFQYPGVLKTTCPLLYSSDGGAGKNRRVETIGSLYHPSHFRPITTSVLECPFNGWRDTTLLAFVDEVESGNRAETNRAIKAIVGNPLYERNQKYQQTTSETGCTNLYLATNKPDALRIEMGDRRIFMIEIDVAQTRRIVNEFDFKAFTAWSSINKHKLLGWMLERDISGFSPYAHAPMTAAKRVMQNQTKPRWEAILDHELETEGGRFAHDVVCVAELMEHLLARHSEKGAGPEHLSGWLRRNGAKSLGRKRFTYAVETTGMAFPKPKTIQTTAWAIRNASRWKNASADQLSGEMLRGAP